MSDTVSDTPGWAVVAVVQYLGEGEKEVVELARGTQAQCERYADRASGAVTFERKDGSTIELPVIQIPVPEGKQVAGAVLAVVPVSEIQSDLESEGR